MITFYESNDGSYCYIPIPKNASTFGTHIFKELLNFKEIQLQSLVDNQGHVWKADKKKHHIVILRDPLDRWFSGVAQYLTETRREFSEKNIKYFNDDFILDPLHVKMFFSHLSFDSHTMTQVSYINHYFPELLSTKTTFFYVKVSEDYISNLEFKTNFEYFVYKNLGEKISSNPLHTSKESKFKSKIKDQLKCFYDNNKHYKNILDNYLQHDYDLLKTVRLYQGIRVSAI